MMKKLRVALVPILFLCAFFALTTLDANVSGIAHFDFIWDVLCGAALGAGLSLLPPMAGLGARKSALSGLFWAGAFAALVLIFYQYMTLLTGMRLSAVAFLTGVGTRARLVEGAVLGYCSFVAGRGKC